MKYAESGYEIQVGDVIEDYITNLFSRKRRVTRVTKTLAICEITGRKPVRYQRVYGFGFHALPYQRTNVSSRVIKAADWAEYVQEERVQCISM